ncbi:hypothetical protein BDF19DRAFT_187694 [Syncephalis fuscata]|nr:hypothetical protein BDF19DRAFT_187694 [Syncephalis fuscata]
MHRRKQCWRATFLERCHAASCNQRRRKVEEQRQIKSSIVNRQRKHTLELDVDPFIDQTVYKRQRQTVHSNELQMKIKVSVAQTECQPSNTCSNMMSHEVAFLPSDDDDENSNYEKQPAVICPLCCAELLNCQDHNILCSCGMNLDVGASLKPLTYLLTVLAVPQMNMP